MLRIVMLFLILFGISAGHSRSQSGKQLMVGDPAIDFSLPYATKDTIGAENLRLTSFIGKKNIILAFYPADWSGGCTREVCTLRDNFSSLGELNAEIFAISGDFKFSHHEWAKYHNLPFTLLSDHSQQIARQYNSYNPETGYDKRTVYLIDKEGKIAYIDLEYSVQDMDSFNKLKDVLQKLQ